MSTSFRYEQELDTAQRSGLTIREVEAWVIASPHPGLGVEIDMDRVRELCRR